MVYLEKNRNGIALEVAELRDKAEKEKQPHEKDLRNQANNGYAHSGFLSYPYLAPVEALPTVEPNPRWPLCAKSDRFAASPKQGIAKRIHRHHIVIYDERVAMATSLRLPPVGPLRIRTRVIYTTNVGFTMWKVRNDPVNGLVKLVAGRRAYRTSFS